MIKKIILTLMFCLSLNLLPPCVHSENFSVKNVFTWDARTEFVHYYFKDNTLFVFLRHGGYYTVLEYKDEKFNVIKTEGAKQVGLEAMGLPLFIDNFFANIQTLGNRGSDNVIKIHDNLHINLNEIYKDRNVEIIDSGKKYSIENTLYSGGSYDVVFVDHMNLKVYFRGKIKEETGVIVCDLKQKTAYIVVKDESEKKYYSPIRVPNTEFLMLYGADIGKFITDILIVEIPEWKEEIEKQAKNKKDFPNAKLYFIDGPANIRNMPKGNVFATLDDNIES